MRTGITQKQTLTQKLSPQQIQLMKLLQIPTATLEQRIKEELEANPALEEGGDEAPEVELPDEDHTADAGDDFELDDYMKDYIEDDPVSYPNGAARQGEEERQIPIAVVSSFHEYLEEQLGLLDLVNGREKIIAEQIVGSIDEDGYLRRDPLSILDDLLFSHNLVAEEQEILAVLDKIQRMDPPGIGARSLQECLSIQLEQKLDNAEQLLDDDELAATELAKKIIDKYFEGFSKKHYEKLQRQLHVEPAELKAAIEVILHLNPKPASGYTAGTSDRAAQYVVPDFILHNREGELELQLNSRNAPDLRINDHYREMLQSYHRKGRKEASKSEQETALFIREKINSARWFIDAIRQRYETMYQVMYAILQYQEDFFRTGDSRLLRPMILKDIQDITGLDVSTISRVANSKFVQTEFGTKRLKDFFSEAMQNAAGEEVSTLKIKRILSEIIENEDKRRPYSDDKLTNLMAERGYKVARRTIAKYRDQLQIPKASLRKEL